MQTVVHIFYLIAAVLFIIGLKKMASIKQARQGNLISAVGMLIAIVATLVDLGHIDYNYILIGLLVGSLLGAVFALKVAMTAMPQMIALLNGMGGLASLLVGLAYFQETVIHGQHGVLTVAAATRNDLAVTVILSVLTGAVTFTGSLVAYAKLQELISGRALVFKGQHWINLLLVGTAGFAGIYGCFFVTGSEQLWLYMALLTGLSLLLGVALVMPIGGADMPVVISLLNSYSGIAAGMTGFVLQNNLLIISGALVGASGIILTQIMCRGMNRSIVNVLFGGFGAQASTASQPTVEYTNIKEAGPEQVSMILENAASVIIVPGYGLAVAQAQHAVREIAGLLEQKGCKVRYAIHPVAGRMPGHMNVLLAEANIPYEQLFEMDLINGDFKSTDVVMVVGANDVVNPAANRDKNSPIYGMPILNVYEAQTVLMLKRSLAAGFSGIRNELFEYPNTLMVFGDAKKILSNIAEELKK